MSKCKAVFVGQTQVLVSCLEHWIALGHEVESIVSDCETVTAWAKQNARPVLSAKSEYAGELANTAFEYLFSIVNHAILPDHVLSMPSSRAINYHDSALPDYAGFNSTAWAIMDGADQHGVTWHTMTADVDGGDILLQRRIPITADDTSFSLGVKCAAACRETFSELVENLVAEKQSNTPIQTRPQGASTSFHRRSERPGTGLINFDQSTEFVQRFVRALQFGREDNWMCTPKVCIGNTILSVTVAESSDSARTEPPGTILSLSSNAVTISTRDGAVRLTELSTLDDKTFDLAASGGKVGDQVSLPPAELEALTAFDAELTKHERYWVRNLADLRSPISPETKPESIIGHGAISRTRSFPPTAYAAALSINFWRSGAEPEVDFALFRPISKQAAAFYASHIPMRVSVDADQTFADMHTKIKESLEHLDARQTYALDVAERYESLRAVGSNSKSLQVGLKLEGEPELLSGTVLTLSVCEEANDVVYSFDTQALSEAEVVAIADRIEVLLKDASERPDAAVKSLNLLTETEKRRLLDLSQGPATIYPQDKCVHNLFEDQVSKTPDHTALIFRNKTLSYRDLDSRANQIAATLVEAGVQPGELVAVCTKRSTEMVAALLGVMKAGAAYVPMDPAYPEDRLAIMLEDSGANVVLTEAAIAQSRSFAIAKTISLESVEANRIITAPIVSVTQDNLAYTIFTSGSTGRPKGVQVTHRNVANFFAGMDQVIGTEPGVWLAVTSISFDISVLEIFWTLARGFEVIIQEETDQRSLSNAANVEPSSTPMEFGFFYFSSSQGDRRPGETYKLLIDGAKFADTHGFQSVWTPERHFHEFGGIFPNPAVTSAALAAITQNVAIRAGSVVLPMHNPIRIAEEWSVIDQLSNGRVGLSFASGWHANDFALMPDNYERRREIMAESIETVFDLWEGKEVEVLNGEGHKIKVRTYPRPVQDRPPIWIASAGNVETFKIAGRQGANVLTNMLGQDLADLRVKLAAYREARAEAGFEGPGHVSLMLHTFVCEDTEMAREIARVPFCNYLKSSFDLVKVAPWMFPAFKRPSLDGGEADLDASEFTEEDVAALMDHAFDRYFETAGLFGSPENALNMVEKLKEVGVNEIACLIDFGIDGEIVMNSLPHLQRLKELSNSRTDQAAEDQDDILTVGETLKQHKVTHLQCTPSMARMLIDDQDVLTRFGSLKHVMLGGEALPADLANTLTEHLTGKFTNMYGPTETTIWSTTSMIEKDKPITIGKPISNTVIRLLDQNGNMVSLGQIGELCIGGDGVVPGYLGRDDLTAERFFADPYEPGARLYRTGDLARYDSNGELEYLGRIDNQVKVNGYRIELGEIETRLSQHPNISQSVVSSYMERGASKLVAYYSCTETDSAGIETVDHWKGLWNTAYDQEAVGVDPRLNFAGWVNSYSNEMIPEHEMREWRNATQQNILNLKPKRVLEIGCGTGMVLYSLLADIEHYSGIDVSSVALETIRAELTPSENERVHLQQLAAHDIDKLETSSFDTVIINSVAQYFPDTDYLTNLLSKISELVADGGKIYVGDVRCLEHLDAFHTTIEVHQAPDDLDAQTLQQNVKKRVQRESELLLSQTYFHSLSDSIPRIQGTEVTLKRGSHANEMTDFRYDVVLRVGSQSENKLLPPAPIKVQGVVDLQPLFEKGEPILFVRGFKNARLAPIMAVLEALQTNQSAVAKDLRARMDQVKNTGVDPEATYELHPDYTPIIVQTCVNDPASFEIVFRHKNLPETAIISLAGANAPSKDQVISNRPADRSQTDEQFKDDLRMHLREALPEYMVPSIFMSVDQFPLTPNGKIDRKALPTPTQEGAPAKADYVAPSNELEMTIAEVWQSLLEKDQISRTDNIFDIGANSLMTAQANQRLSSRLGKRIPLISMFRYPSVEKLAQHLGQDSAQRNKAKLAEEPKLNRREQAAAKRRAMRREQAT